MADNQSPEEIAERLGKSIEWARDHTGRHRCVDGRRYIYSCLVSDVSCDKVARSYMRLSETERTG
jgi:hypothetical protein